MSLPLPGGPCCFQGFPVNFRGPLWLSGGPCRFQGSPLLPGDRPCCFREVQVFFATLRGFLPLAGDARRIQGVFAASRGSLLLPPGGPCYFQRVPAAFRGSPLLPGGPCRFQGSPGDPLEAAGPSWKWQRPPGSCRDPLPCLKVAETPESSRDPLEVARAPWKRHRKPGSDRDPP